MTIIMLKLLAICFSLMILGNAFIVKKHVGTWLFPSCIFSLFWFLYTFLPLLFLFTVPAEPASIAFIFVCTVFFSLSSFCFNWNSAIARNQTKPAPNYVFNNKFILSVFYISALTSFICMFLNIFLQGISAYDIVSNIFGAAGQFANMRYKGELKSNIFGQLNLLLSYVAVTTGGLVFGSTKSIWLRRKVVLVAFLPALGAMILQSAKGLFFLSAALFIGSVLVTRVYDNNLYLIDRKTIKSFIIFVAMVFPALIISFLSRGLLDSGDNSFILQKLVTYFASYAFGHLYAFSDWFSSYIGSQSILSYNHENTGFGFYTFMAIFKSLGSTQQVPQGVYDDYFFYKDVLTSNIFTIFRGLITDFGIMGTMLYMMISGLFFNSTFYCMLTDDNPSFTASIFIFMTGYFYISFIISFLIWNVILVSFVFLYFILSLNKLYLCRQHSLRRI